MAADGGGFDAEKFRKIVAMFDSPYDEERKTAFILALELLRKNELRFCDRLVDRGEVKEAQAELQRVLAELEKACRRAEALERENSEWREVTERLREDKAFYEHGARVTERMKARPVSVVPGASVRGPKPRGFGRPIFWKALAAVCFVWVLTILGGNEQTAGLVPWLLALACVGAAGLLLKRLHRVMSRRAFTLLLVAGAVAAYALTPLPGGEYLRSTAEIVWTAAAWVAINAWLWPGLVVVLIMLVTAGLEVSRFEPSRIKTTLWVVAFALGSMGGAGIFAVLVFEIVRGDTWSVGWGLGAAAAAAYLVLRVARSLIFRWRLKRILSYDAPPVFGDAGEAWEDDVREAGWL